MTNDVDDGRPEGQNGKGTTALGSKADTVELARLFVAQCGGAEEFARLAAEELRNTPPGSHVRSTIFKMFVGLIEESTRVSESRGDDDMDQWSEERLRNHLELFVRRALLADPKRWRPVLDLAESVASDAAVKSKLIDEIDAQLA